MLVNYHKKSESIKVHLNNCAAFRKVMNDMEDGKRPEWYRRNKKGATRLVIVAKNAGSMSSVSSSLQSSIKKYALSTISKTHKAKFQKHMAIHYYATGTSFQRVEDLHLKNVIYALRPNKSLLPSRKQLGSILLDKCHAEVLSKVDLRLSGATVCLTTDAWSNIKNDFVINYMVVSPTCSLFFESMSTGQQGHDHKFIARDIERMIIHHENTSFADTVIDNANTRS
jgi:hypothetical protein